MRGGGGRAWAGGLGKGQGGEKGPLIASEIIEGKRPDMQVEPSIESPVLRVCPKGNGES